MNGKSYLGRQVSAFQSYDEVGPVTGIALVVDENNEILAGDQSGYVLEVPCAYGTQAMADELLALAKGRTYRGYTADKARLAPLAELGDGVTVNGMYGLLAYRSVDFGGGHASQISAPGENVINHEYPLQSSTSSKLQRRTDRQIAETRSSITKTAQEIRLQVANDVAGLEASIRVNADAIEQRVSKNGIVSAINQSPEQITIQAGKISLEGAVSVNRSFQIDTDGYLRCNGGTIGGFTVGASALYNGLGSLGGTANGVYVGTDGIALGGGKFKVTSGGNLSATNATISGTVNATAGRFESVTIVGSSLGGTLDGVDGSLVGVNGSVSNLSGTLKGMGGSVSGLGGTLSSMGGSVNSLGGSYVGECSGSSLTACDVGASRLYVGGTGSYVYASASGSNCVHGSSTALLQAAGNTLTMESGGASKFSGQLTVTGSFTCNGTKSRAMATEDFGTRCLDAYETAAPTFADYGTARIGEDGVCVIAADPVFSETVDGAYRPTVFLTKYGEGELWVADAAHDRVTVRGTPGLRFSWETRYRQRNSYGDRLRALEIDDPQTPNYDFAAEAAGELEHSAVHYGRLGLEDFEAYTHTAPDYGESGAYYFEQFERRLTA